MIYFERPESFCNALHFSFSSDILLATHNQKLLILQFLQRSCLILSLKYNNDRPMLSKSEDSQLRPRSWSFVSNHPSERCLNHSWDLSGCKDRRTPVVQNFDSEKRSFHNTFLLARVIRSDPILRPATCLSPIPVWQKCFRQIIPKVGWAHRTKVQEATRQGASPTLHRGSACEKVRPKPCSHTGICINVQMDLVQQPPIVVFTALIATPAKNLKRTSNRKILRKLVPSQGFEGMSYNIDKTQKKRATCLHPSEKMAHLSL